MPIYWFKGPVGEPFQFQCGPDGIHVPGLAEKAKLKPRPLELNGVVVDFDKSSGYLSLQDAQEFIQGLGGSTETAIIVDGQPVGATAGGTAAAAAAGAAGAAEEAWVQATIKRRCPCSSKYAAHLNMLDSNNHVIREAATVVDAEYIATFAHQPHTGWRIGQTQQVSLHSGDGDKRRVVKAKVVLIDLRSDIAILQVDEKLPEAPVLDAALSPGERYYLHGQSTQAQADSSSISHGVIAATELDARCHIRGDMPSGRGDSGGGCFSIETGKLIAINVGRDNAAHKAVLVPSAVIQHMLAQLKSP